MLHLQNTILKKQNKNKRKNAQRAEISTDNPKTTKI